MHKALVTVIFSALLLVAAYGIWVFGFSDLVSQFPAMKLNDVPTSNIILAACFAIVALAGLMAGRHESAKSRS